MMVSMTDHALHRDHPETISIVIEQPRSEPWRIEYDAQTGQFHRSNHRALLHQRGFPGHYGWISGTGTPPGVHYDVFVLDDLPARPGDTREGTILVLFVRGDGDHKFLADARPTGTRGQDLSLLPPDEQRQIFQLYPRVDAGEGWLGRAEAIDWLMTHPPTHV